MAVFRDGAHAEQVIGTFFQRAAAQADNDKIFAGSGLVIGYDLQDPKLRIVMDASVKPEPGKAYDVYVNDPAAPEPRVDLIMDCDTLDALYRGEAHATALITSGKMKIKGDTALAMRMLPAMARAIPYYKKYREIN